MIPMLDALLNAVLPIFAVVAIGYAMARGGMVDGEVARHVNRFVFVLAVPILLFRLVGTAPLGAFDWSVLLAYLLAEIAVYVAGFAVARFLCRVGIAESVLIGMTAAFANHVFFVLPIAENLLGAQAAVPIAAIVAVDAVVFYGGTVVVMDLLVGRGEGRSLLATFAAIGRNPQVIALAAGLAANLAGLPFFAGLDLFTGFVGAAAAPAALFTLGIILATPRGPVPWTAATSAAVLRLVGMPAITLVLLSAFSAAPAWSAPAILVAAGPCGAMPLVIGLQYRVPVDRIVRAILLSTIASLASLPLALELAAP